MARRALDIFGASVLLALFFIPLVLIGVVVKLTPPGPVLYWSKRVEVFPVGQHKFRGSSELVQANRNKSNI